MSNSKEAIGQPERNAGGRPLGQLLFSGVEYLRGFVAEAVRQQDAPEIESGVDGSGRECTPWLDQTGELILLSQRAVVRCQDRDRFIGSEQLRHHRCPNFERLPKIALRRFEFE